MLLFLACADPDQPSEPATRDAVTWPFTSDSPWNVPLGAEAAFDDGDCTATLRDESVDAWINAEEWSHPIYRAAEGDPWVEIRDGEDLRATIQLPVEATPALPPWPDTDAHLHVVDPTGRWVDETWKAQVGDAVEVQAWARNDLYGPGIGEGGVRIYGGSALGGLVRRGEIQGGIPHALALSLPVEAILADIVWPATDLTTTAELSGNIPVGQLVALPADFDVSALSPEGAAVARALRDYGAYVVDYAKSFTFYAEPSLEAEVDPARDDLDPIRAALACVTNNSAASPGGPGPRRAAFAPELGEAPE